MTSLDIVQSQSKELWSSRMLEENGRADDPGHYPVKGSRPFATLTVLFPLIHPVPNGPV